MSKAGEKNAMEEWMEVQQKLFNQWKELAEEYNNTKLLEMFGDDCKDAWNSCLKMQEEVFSLWQESVKQFQPYNMAAHVGDKTYSIWNEWWQMQQKLLKSIEKDFMKSNNSFTPFSTPFSFFPYKNDTQNQLEATVKLFENWAKMMNEMTETMGKQWSSDIQEAASKPKSSGNKSS